MCWQLIAVALGPDTRPRIIVKSGHVSTSLPLFRPYFFCPFFVSSSTHTCSMRLWEWSEKISPVNIISKKCEQACTVCSWYLSLRTICVCKQEHECSIKYWITIIFIYFFRGGGRGNLFLTPDDNFRQPQRHAKKLNLEWHNQPIFFFLSIDETQSCPCSCGCRALSCTAILHNVFTIPPEGINQKLHDSLTNLQARKDHGGNQRKRERTKERKKHHREINIALHPFVSSVYH